MAMTYYLVKEENISKIQNLLSIASSDINSLISNMKEFSEGEGIRDIAEKVITSITQGFHNEPYMYYIELGSELIKRVPGENDQKLFMFKNPEVEGTVINSFTVLLDFLDEHQEYVVVDKDSDILPINRYGSVFNDVEVDRNLI